MLAAKRHREILHLLKTDGSVRTVALAAKFSVTDETIRRDLESLDREGLLRRTHGGAIPVPRERLEVPYDERKVRNMAEKKEIAATALELIEPNDAIFLDPSSTTVQLAAQMPDMPLTVITNSHFVIAQLLPREHVKLIATGGTYDRRSHSYVGPAAVSVLDRYRIDKVFCSGDGIEPTRGTSDINEWQSMIKETAIRRAHLAVFLADHTKIGEASTHYFAACSQFHQIITDAHAPEDILDRLRQQGPEVRRSNGHSAKTLEMNAASA